MTALLTRNHAKMQSDVQKHIAADAVIQNAYWDGSRGCFIGCLAHSSDAARLQEIYGLPLPLVRICESVFEGLHLAEAIAFFAAIPGAVGRDGKDLSRVHWAFLAAELRALPAVPAEIQSAIDPVIAGMDLMAAGEEWSRLDARAAWVEADAYVHATYADAAQRAAYAVARDAALSAAYAARAADAYSRDATAAAAATAATRAATAALAARLRQRDTLLALITAA